VTSQFEILEFKEETKIGEKNLSVKLNFILGVKFEFFT